MLTLDMAVSGEVSAALNMVVSGEDFADIEHSGVLLGHR